MNAIHFRAAALCLLATLGACGRSAPDGPPQLRVGRDECAECGMIIMDDRACAALLVEIGGRREHRVFDDLGCLIDFRERRPATSTEVLAFAVDHGDGTWLKLSDARFLLADPHRLLTPMGSGYIAFADPRDAEGASSKFGGATATLDGLIGSRRAWRESLRISPTPGE